ncbi:hypothetical protein INT46_002969, partial [Mucor plumbeus]
DTVLKVFKNSFKNENSKVNKEALQLSCEFLRLFTLEAIHRASKEQDDMSRLDEQDGPRSRKKLEVEHLERILPQLLLDF